MNSKIYYLPGKTVGNKIRKKRLLKEITQKELADFIDAAKGTIDTYEFNQAYPSPEKLKKIAEFLDVPVEYFFDQYYEFVFGDYGNKIKEWRVKNELTLKEAAVIVGVNANTLSKWEKDIRYPDRIKYTTLLKFMDISKDFS